MKLTREQFIDWPNKSITLLGMSGVGKTTLSSLLPTDQWFHYSGDYRIGTRYLNEAILNQVKKMAMEHPFLRDQLRKDAIYIRSNVTIENLGPISDYLGKIGNPDLGGLELEEFNFRQALFREAEVQAMNDVSAFIDKARNIYGYPHFLNDAGGSICGLGHEECWDQLSQNSLVLYLEANEEMEEVLIERAQKYPKPLNYEVSFLNQHVEEYLHAKKLESDVDIVPDEFVQWIFPKLLKWRKPQYQRIAERYGHTADASKIFELRDEDDFIEFVCDAIEHG
ncbi:MAG: hypothetical protein KTR18_13440 [Acidiferrobacterales bacterium]|nr:hypothetical protein [Acidiferrobacterales bacterium]